MLSDSEEYDLFLSYNKMDAEFGAKLVKRIEREEYGGKKLRCFFAEWDINPGENILLMIEKAIEKSRFVGFVLSPEWEKSSWTTLERVIPVYEDPNNIKGRVLPIYRSACIIPPSIKVLKWFDFSTDSNFEREAKKVIARLKGQSLRALLGYEVEQQAKVVSVARSDSIAADIQSETLASNLFPVLELPNLVYVARTSALRRQDVFSRLGENIPLPIFSLPEESFKIYTFTDLDKAGTPLNEVLTGEKLETMRTLDLIKDKNRTPTLIDLLNRCMTQHMKDAGMIYDWKNKKTYLSLESPEQEIRSATWIVGKRPFTRMVVRKANTKRIYYIHRSCKATFTDIDIGLYLKILPGWHFTDDGISTPVPAHMMSSLSSRWMNKDRNHSILDDVRFSEFKPKHPKENLNMITYHAFAKSALRKRGLRVEIDFLMENIDLPTVEVDKVPTFATTSEKIRCYTPDVLIGDKILTLARGSIGSQKIDDYPKQIYDLSMLISRSKCTNFAEVIRAVRVLSKIEAQIFRMEVTPEKAIEDVIGFIDDDLATLDLPNANSQIRKSIESFEAYYSPRKHSATREGWSTRSLKIRFVAELVKSVLVGNETSDDALRNLSRASEAAARLATLEGEKIRETRRQLFTFAQEKLPRELEGSSLERVFWEVARPENIDKLTSVPS